MQLPSCQARGLVHMPAVSPLHPVNYCHLTFSTVLILSVIHLQAAPAVGKEERGTLTFAACT
eukprot:m.266551 g.266551  ORF g.266551 m.266551 type:complete len:62 (-) comp66357_c0_seq1:62-247(-)